MVDQCAKTLNQNSCTSWNLLIPDNNITAVNNVDFIIVDGHAVIHRVPQPTQVMIFNELTNVFMRYIINIIRDVI